MLRDGGAISVQVLNEIANVARRKMRNVVARDARRFCLSLRGLLTVHPDHHRDARDWGSRSPSATNLAIYDALIAASALLAECDRLWSEDMQDGMAIDRRLRIVNPFRERKR